MKRIRKIEQGVQEFRGSGMRSARLPDWEGVLERLRACGVAMRELRPDLMISLFNSEAAPVWFRELSPVFS
jgi:hypothetical protein